MSRKHVLSCIKYARENNDKEGEHLARLILRMTKDERRELYRRHVHPEFLYVVEPRTCHWCGGGGKMNGHACGLCWGTGIGAYTVFDRPKPADNPHGYVNPKCVDDYWNFVSDHFPTIYHEDQTVP